MAFNVAFRRLGLTISTVTRSVTTQTTFAGLRAAAVFGDSSGFGYNSKGQLVIVKKTNDGTSTDGYNYGKLFNKLESSHLVGSLTHGMPTKPIVDSDLWIESSNKPNDRGLNPWSRPLVSRCGPHRSASFSSLSGNGCNSKVNNFPTSLVIFDKDGTLIDVNSVWIPWMESHVQELEEMTGMDLSEKLYSAVGYCPTEKEYQDNGLLAHATIADIKEKFKEVLVQSGVDEVEAGALIDGCCVDFDTGDQEILEPLGDLTNIFETLKSNGVKTAVCTMDSRHGTMSALDRLGLTSMVDKIVCGDDKLSKPKPAPDNALNICKDLNICPTKTIVIGDTTADTGMGKSAGLGLTVGVLSGAGSKRALEKDSDIVLNSVDELLDLIFTDNADKSM